MLEKMRINVCVCLSACLSFCLREREKERGEERVREKERERVGLSKRENGKSEREYVHMHYSQVFFILVSKKTINGINFR